MGTYKHIGRIRSARLIGCDLAAFYLRVGETQMAVGEVQKAVSETQKAVVYFGDALRMFEDDCWHELAAQTRLQLADCYRHIPDWERWVHNSSQSF